MKGFSKTLEALIAMLTIVSAFLVIFPGGEKPVEHETAAWKLLAFNVLDFLEKNNTLSKLAVEGDTSAIEEMVEELLPPSLESKVMICEQSCEDPGIVAEKIVSVEYLIGGYEQRVEPRRVVLFVWRAE